MSDGKHTPGPWVADWTIRSGSDERQARGWHVHNGNETEPVICDIPDDGRHDGCRVANARLIAAAPEMLAELTDLRKHVADLKMRLAGVGACFDDAESEADDLRARLAAAEAERDALRAACKSASLLLTSFCDAHNLSDHQRKRAADELWEIYAALARKPAAE
jgi:hypothetical protein